MKRYVMLFFVILILGCLSQGEREIDEYPIKVIDGLSREVFIEKVPERIVSTSPSNTEILFSLDLGEKIVGVTTYCNYPEEAKSKEKIGGFSDLDLEKIVSLEPELVLMSGGVQEKYVEKLEQLGLVLVVLKPENLDEILENITLVGKITGKDVEAERLVKNTEERIKKVEEKASRSEKKRVFYIVWGDPLMTAGGDTFTGELIKKAGGLNIFDDIKGYKEVDLELVVERNPEIIITNTHSGIDFDALRRDERFKTIDAIRNNRLYIIDADLISRPGPRIVQALELFLLWISGG
ncbi:MAG: ABC transporter substrate-binding protein [Candidatus Methanofastidiosia archaeon]